MDEIKVCKCCKRELPATREYFIVDKGFKCGFKARCKECMGGKFKVKNESGWTKQQDDFLIKHYNEYDNKALGEIFKKSEKTVQARTIKLGITKSEEYMSEQRRKSASIMNEGTVANDWEDSNLELLKMQYPNYSNVELSEIFFKDKTPKQIYNIANRIGLSKSKEHMKKIQLIRAKLAGKITSIKFRKRITLKCAMCESDIDVIPSKVEKNENCFCSLECRSKWRSINRSGKNSPLFGKMSDMWTEEMRREQAERKVLYLSQHKDDMKKTKPQMLVDLMLEDMDIVYENEYNCKYYSIDDYLNEYNLMIEVQGNFFHCNPSMSVKNSREKFIVSKDIRKNKYVKKYYEISILYLWEYDIIKKPKLCVELIKQYIRNNGVLEDYNSFNYEIDVCGDLKLIENKYIIGY